MPTALPLPTRISQGFSRKRKPRALHAQYGEGVSHDLPDGLNPLVDECSITYENLTLAERNSVWAVLDTVGAWGQISYTAPSDTAKLWKLTPDGAQETVTGSQYYNISFSLRQVF